LRPVAISDVKIGMADAARFHGNQNFARAGLGPRDICEHERRLEFLEDSSFHAVTLKTAKLEIVVMSRAP
jgi:hypothetical protein